MPARANVPDPPLGDILLTFPPGVQNSRPMHACALPGTVTMLKLADTEARLQA